MNWHSIPSRRALTALAGLIFIDVLSWLVVLGLILFFGWLSHCEVFQ